MHTAKDFHSKGRDFVTLLKACAKLRNLQQGIDIHEQVSRLGLLERDRFLSSTLVDMYAKCGAMVEAHKLFEELVVRDVVSWTALIRGYAENGNAGIALKCFEQMQFDCVAPDAVTYLCCLKACGSVQDHSRGHELHMEIESKGLFDNDLNLGNALVDIYGKCGSLTEAQHVFNKLAVRDVISWTALIAGHVEDGQCIKAFRCMEEMQMEGVFPNPTTFVCSLKASVSMKNLEQGYLTHAEIERRGLLQKDIVLGNTLIDMYVKCGTLHLAHDVFSQLHIRDVVSWTSMIMGYTEHGHGEEALIFFEHMQREGIQPNTATLVCALKACARAKATSKGQEIHESIKREGLLEKDFSLGTSLIDMYAKCGLIMQAQEIFDNFMHQDVVTWNALLMGYADCGHDEKLLQLFEQMQKEGVFADAVTYICFLRSCAGANNAFKARNVHVQILMKGLSDADFVVGTALMDTYAKCGNLEGAQTVFDKLPIRDVVSWTALIACYAEHGCGEEALNCLETMQLQGMTPNLATLVCSLKACGTIGASDRGRELHVEIERKGLLEKDPAVGNTLVDMYSKCGVLGLAQQVFDRLLVHDVVSWNSLIAGYIQQNQSAAPLQLFERMLSEGIHPNAVTLLVILNACSRIGFFNLTQTYVDTMSKDFGIIPTLEHHSSMIHLLCQAGQLDKAVSVLKEKPSQSTCLSWRTVLNACTSCTNMKLGNEAFEHAVSSKMSSPHCNSC